MYYLILQSELNYAWSSEKLFTKWLFPGGMYDLMGTGYFPDSSIEKFLYPGSGKMIHNSSISRKGGRQVG